MANRTPTTITLLEAYRRAEAALTGGDPLRAIALTQHILRFYPHYLDAYRLLGEAYFERAHADEALRFFSHVLAADPQNVLARVGRAIIADERRQVDVAIAEYEQAFEIDPSITEVRGELLRLYQTRYGSAGATIRLTPSGLAYVHLRAGLREAAISELGYVAQLRPDRWDIEVALAEALWRNEQLDEAAAVAGDILAGHPACVKCCWMLGYLHWTAGRTESGRRYLMEAVALDPTYRIAQALWDATPWPLNRAVARVQPAPIPAPSPYDLVGADMDLTLSLPAFLDAADPAATPPAGEAAPVGGHSPLLPDAVVADEAPVGGHSPLLPDAAAADEAPVGGQSLLLPDPAADEAPVGGQSLLIPDAADEEGFVMLPGTETTPVPVEPPALDLDWFDDWASAADQPASATGPVALSSLAPVETVAEIAHVTVPTDPAEIWAQFIAPGRVGAVLSQYPPPVTTAVDEPETPVPDTAPDAPPAMQPPLFAEVADPAPPQAADSPAVDLLLSSATVPEGRQLALDLPAAVLPPPDPAQLALDLPEPPPPGIADAMPAAGQVAHVPPVAALTSGRAVAPTPDLPTMRIANLSDDALLDWLLQAHLPPTDDAPQTETDLPVTVAAVDPLGGTGEKSDGDGAAPPVAAAVDPADVVAEKSDSGAAMPPLDLPVIVAAAAAEPNVVAPVGPRAADGWADPAMPSLDPAATDVTAFSEDDLLDWLTHHAPAVDPGANGSSAAPVATPDLQALDSAAIATLTADDLLDWLTVAAPVQATAPATVPVAGFNGAELTHNSSEVRYNQRVLTDEVGYNHSAPDGVPDGRRQRPPGPPDHG